MRNPHLSNLNPYVYLSDNYVVVDFETTNLDKGSPYNKDNRIILAAWKYKGETKVRWGSEYELQELVHDIEQADFMVAQHAKFELGWLERCGLDIGEVVVYDTMLGQYVINGNRKTPLDLDFLCRRYGLPTKSNVVKAMIGGGVCPSDIPAIWLEKYCVGDVLNTEQVMLRQRDELNFNRLLPVLFTRCFFTPVLADIEKNGMYLSKERVCYVTRKLRAEFEGVTRELRDVVGRDLPSSGKQIAAFLYDELGLEEIKGRDGQPTRTDGGARRTDVGTITNLRGRTVRQKLFLALKKRQSELAAALTKNLNKFYDCVYNAGGILYAQFNQAITQTHRLSSSGKPPYTVQFQNFARAFKPMFKARHEGWRLGEIDGAQLEFRVAAHLGRDVTALEAIKLHFDVHSFTAQVLTEAGQPTDRQNAKAHTFKPLYGGQSGTKAEQAYYKAFREKYPGIASTQQSWLYSVAARKQLTTETGLVFYWPDTKMTGTGYITNTPTICNYPVQSLATADIIPVAVRYLWQALRESKARSFLVNTIHDSAICEIHPEEEELFEKLGVQAFTSKVYDYLAQVYGIDFTVPLEADVKIKDFWSDSDNWKKEWLNEH